VGHLAVFLSYASQDAAAARRVCGSLRAAGIEVWFDQSELRGGDAWDQSIRRQIKECALFIPLISASTQARAEGYFRREWKLAVERTHDMADHVPFLLPVLLDATKDREAHVPEKFREVQWTALPDGLTPPAFCARVQALLQGVPTAASEGPSRRAPLAARRSAWPLIVAAAGAGLAIVLTMAWWTHTLKTEASRAATAAPAATPSAASGLIERMWAIYDRGPDSTREDWILAQQLGAQAVAGDPLNPDAWAVYAQVTLYDFVWTNDPVYDDALNRAQRAISLAPDSFQARFALAHVYEEQLATFADSERLFRQLLQERPEYGPVLRCLANLLELHGQLAEALAISTRAVAALPQDAYSWSKNAMILAELGRTAPALESAEKALALRRGPSELGAKAQILTWLRDDFAAAAAVTEQIAPAALAGQLDRYSCGQFWLCDRQPEKALAVFQASTGEAFFGFPKAYYIGCSLDLMGRQDAATAEWRQALKQVETALGAQPDEVHNLILKAVLLAHLGDRDGADRALAFARQFPSEEPGMQGYFATATLTLLGRKAEAVAEAKACWPKINGTLQGGWGNIEFPLAWRTLLIHDPIFDPLRSDPTFQEFIRQIRGDPRFPLPLASQ